MGTGWSGSSVLRAARVLGRKVLPANPRPTWWVMAALVWLGVVLRARGMWLGRPISLWEDEAFWAMRLINLPLREHVMRSVGFMAVTKALVVSFSASEHVLRFLPWCAGTGAVLLAPFAAKRLHRSDAAQLLFVAVVALHPSAIDLSKEFKPYSVALFVHLLLLLFVLRYLDERRQRDLLVAVAVAFFGVLFSQDVIFAYPMAFGLLAWVAYRSKNRQHLGMVLGGAGFALILLLVLLQQAAPKLGDTNEGAQYWGNKYNVFFVAGGHASRLGWTVARLVDLAGMLGKRRELWHPSYVSPETLAGLERADAALWALLCLSGVVVLAYRKRFLHLTLLVAPLLVMMGFNFVGLWPLGAFRTNLFTIAYCAGLAAAVFDATRPRERTPVWDLLPAALLVVLPFLTLGRSNHSRKESDSAQASFSQAAQELLKLQGNGATRNVLLLDSPSCAPWRYYAHYHPSKSQTDLANRFRSRCSHSFDGMVKHAHEALAASSAPVFLLAAGDKQMAALRSRLPTAFRVVAQKTIGKDDALVLELKLARP